MSGHSRSDHPDFGEPEFDREVRRAPRIVDMAPWLVVGCGVGVMIFLFVAVLAGLPGTRPGPVAGPAGFSPAWPFGPDAERPTPAGDEVSPTWSPSAAASIPPGGEAATGGPATTAGGPAATATGRTPPAARPAPTTASPTRTRPADPPPRPEVTGRYRVMASFHDSFQGEVLVTNNGPAARQWSVELRFPGNVGRLQTSWVESAPQATLRRSGDRYIFTSTVPLAAGSSVPLRFQFDRSGRGDLPSDCRVNGTRCAGF